MFLKENKLLVCSRPFLHIHEKRGKGGRVLMLKKTRFKAPLPFRSVLLLSFFLFMLCTIFGVWLVDQSIRPAVMDIAHSETQKIAVAAINEAVRTEVVDRANVEEMVHVEKNGDGQVTSVQFNAEIYNEVLSEATLKVQEYLKWMEKGGLPGKTIAELKAENNEAEGIIHAIPLGKATNNALLAQLGPLIPIRFMPIGDVTTNLSESIQETGINNTYLRISLEVAVDARIIIPFGTEQAIVTTEIPIGMVFISGEVPYYYHRGENEGAMPAMIPGEEQEGE